MVQSHRKPRTVFSECFFMMRMNVQEFIIFITKIRGSSVQTQNRFDRKKENAMRITTQIVAVIVCLMLPLSVFAWPVPDTGQTKCYDYGKEIPCPQPGEPYYGLA